MAVYTFAFNEISEMRVWFEAESAEHAQELFRQAVEEKIILSDLPRARINNDGIMLEFDSQPELMEGISLE